MPPESPSSLRQTLAARIVRCARHRLALPVALFAGFFGFYLNTSQSLRETPIFDRLDVFFESDSRRVWKDMVGERLGSHSHSSGHPNFVIFHQPVGWTLTWLLKEFDFEDKKVEAAKTAATLMTCAGAAGVVVFLYLMLTASAVPRFRAGLFACVLGFSTVQKIFSAIPETYIFSALGLTAAACLAVRGARREAGWQLAVVYAWSALTTNIVQLGIWSVVRHWHQQWPVLIRRVTVGLALSSGLMVAINVAQSWIYPESDLFFIPHSVSREARWIDWDRLQSPWQHARILLQHQWITNIIAPEPVKVMNQFRPEWSTASVEAGAWAQFTSAWPLFALWGTVLVGAVTALTDRRFYTPATIGALAVMAFNFCFFFVFGHDRMLYAALWTSISVYLIAMGWESLIRRVPFVVKVMPPLLIVLLAGQSWHNWHFLDKIAALVK